MATNIRYVDETRDEAGFIIEASYAAWDCEKCGAEVRRYRGISDVDCLDCSASYNASGQRLRSDWRDNPSWKYGDCDDLTGFELQHARLVSDDNYSAFLVLFQGAVAVGLYLQHHPAPKPVDARLFNT